MISGLYNTIALVETYTLTTDSYGQNFKTWTVSTTVIGCKQSRSGSESVIDTQERISKSEIFYCDEFNIKTEDRLVFSTKSFTYQGTADRLNDMASTVTGALYFVSTAFSTYVQYDYAIYDTDSSGYIINDVERNNILYINDRLRGHHLQIDLDLGFKSRT